MGHHTPKNISLALTAWVRVRDAWRESEWLQPLVVGVALSLWLLVILVVLLAVA